MKQFQSKSRLKGIALVFLSIFLSFQSFGQAGIKLFDTFDRTPSLTLNQPSSLSLSNSSNTTTWLETETAGSNNYRVRIENNMLVMGSLNNATTPVGSSGQEQASFDATGLYATVFNQASAPLTWAFNFRQSRNGTSGFGATTYGIAYIIGSTKAVFTDPTASGYAVIIGNSGSPDYVKLVSFKNGFTANSNLTTLLTSGENGETGAYSYSVKVTYDPCVKSWGLQVRNDGSNFQDPASVPDPTVSFPDQAYTNLNLPFTGALYNHGTLNVTAAFDFLYFPAAQTQTAQFYTWTGTVSTDFTDPGNWSPARNTCTRASDVLVFNSGSTLNITNVTSLEIGRLLVQNNTNLILKGKTGSTQTLQITGGDQEDLVVSAGSSLIIDSNDALEISLKSGATGSIFGTISLQNSSQNLGKAHRLLIADASALVMNAGSQFVAKNLSGEPFGTTGAANAVIFKANSVYISKDGASPFGLATPNSKVVFQTGSLYRHEQIGTAPKFDGRVYADFELNVAGNLAIIFGTSAATPSRIDNFTISNGTMNVTLTSGATPLPLNIRGNLTVASGAAFNFNPAATSNSSTISFIGQEPQTLSGNINLGQFANLEINNPAGINLNTNLLVRGNMVFTNGIFSVATGRNLIFEDNATVTGAGQASYVQGKVIKTGDDAFTFPTGKGGYYAPIAITAPLNTTDQYAAEYFFTNPGQLFGNITSDSLVQVSNSEYWDLERLVGNSEVNVTLSYDPVRSTIVQNPQALRIAHFKAGAGWVNEGRVAVNSNPGYSLYATLKPQASFSPFTFGSVAGNSALPVEFLFFKAVNKNNQVELNWATASETNNDRFAIERSTNGIDFIKIGDLKGTGNSNTEKRYAFIDKNPLPGKAYYRLKQIDLDGTATYSNVAQVNAALTSASVLLFPNPTAEHLTMKLTNVEIISQPVFILNSLGVQVKTVSIPKGNSELKLEVADLPAGIYFIRIPEVPQPIKFQKI